jgi:hypothetical protein
MPTKAKIDLLQPANARPIKIDLSFSDAVTHLLNVKPPAKPPKKKPAKK